MENMICALCNLPMEKSSAEFEYMNHSFSHEFLSCPKCRQVYIPEDIAKGRMADVERELEDK